MNALRSKPILIPPRVAQRAATKFTVDPSTGCHLSGYSTGSHGYAQIGWRDGERTTMTTAHRASWVNTYGQIADEMTIDHMCKNKICVNVLHLRVLSNFENARRTNGNDWKLGHCIQGHPNSRLKLYSRGLRHKPQMACRDCKREAQRNYIATKNGS